MFEKSLQLRNAKFLSYTTAMAAPMPRHREKKSRMVVCVVLMKTALFCAVLVYFLSHFAYHYVEQRLRFSENDALIGFTEKI